MNRTPSKQQVTIVSLVCDIERLLLKYINGAIKENTWRLRRDKIIFALKEKTKGRTKSPLEILLVDHPTPTGTRKRK